MPSKLFLLAPVMAVLLWAGNVTVTKLSADAIAPGAIAFYRGLLATLTMTPFLYRSVFRNRNEIMRQLPKLAFLGFLAMAVNQGAAFYAAATTTATHIGVLNSLIPLFTVAMSGLLLKEMPNWGTLVGGGVSLIGLTWLISNGHPLGIVENGVNHGDGLMLIATIAYALYSVLLRQWQSTLPIWTSLYIQVLIGTLFLLPGFLLAPSREINWLNAPMIVYAGTMAAVLAPFLWMVGIRHLGANRTSICMNLLPVVTTILAISILHESVSAPQLIGIGLTISGVFIAQIVTRPLAVSSRILVKQKVF